MTTTALPSAVPRRGTVAADLRALAGGVRAMLPLLAGVTPFGMVIGVTIGDLGAPTLPGWSLSWLVYAGSAQLAVLPLLAHGGSVALAVLTVTLMNLRLALYGAAFAPHWRGTGRVWRAVASYLVIDPSFVVGMEGYDAGRGRRHGHLHFLGGAVVLWLGWQGATALGVTAGSLLPGSLQLDFLAPLYTTALVVPAVAANRRLRLPVAVGAGTAALATLLPMHLGPAAGMLAGLTAASLLAARGRGSS